MSPFPQMYCTCQQKWSGSNSMWTWEVIILSIMKLGAGKVWSGNFSIITQFLVGMTEQASFMTSSSWSSESYFSFCLILTFHMGKLSIERYFNCGLIMILFVPELERSLWIRPWAWVCTWSMRLRSCQWYRASVNSSLFTNSWKRETCQLWSTNWR